MPTFPVSSSSRNRARPIRLFPTFEPRLTPIPPRKTSAKTFSVRSDFTVPQILPITRFPTPGWCVDQRIIPRKLILRWTPLRHEAITMAHSRVFLSLFPEMRISIAIRPIWDLMMDLSTGLSNLISAAASKNYDGCEQAIQGHCSRIDLTDPSETKTEIHRSVIAREAALHAIPE